MSSGFNNIILLTDSYKARGGAAPGWQTPRDTVE